MKQFSNNQKLKLSLSFLILLSIIAVPAVVWSNPQNPPLAKTGAPGEGTCAGCHDGGSGGGSIAITSSAGTKYQAGVKQHLTVTIADPNAKAWGYEITAVQAAKPTVGAGKFKATDKLSNVRKSGTKSYASQMDDQSGKTKTVSYAFDWTPPKKAVGNITLYVAGVGDDNTNPPASSSIYLGNLTLTPQ
jgi:hypothetical protein